MESRQRQSKCQTDLNGHHWKTHRRRWTSVCLSIKIQYYIYQSFGPKSKWVGLKHKLHLVQNTLMPNTLTPTTFMVWQTGGSQISHENNHSLKGDFCKWSTTDVRLGWGHKNSQLTWESYDTFSPFQEVQIEYVCIDKLSDQDTSLLTKITLHSIIIMECKVSKVCTVVDAKTSSFRSCFKSLRGERFSHTKTYLKIHVQWRHWKYIFGPKSCDCC